jgi:adenylate kinase
MPRVVILLGPPGAGKGTQAARLSKELALPHVSTGDLFRDNLARNTELGREARSYMDSGKLVPDALVLGMLFDRVAKPDCESGYLLDGFPRTLPQAEALERALPRGTKVTALNLRVSDEAIVERLGGRRTCEACGHIHQLRFSPPKVANQCDRCGGKLVLRTDDSPEVVQKRLRVYREQTQPLEAFYAARGGLTHVDGAKAPDEVFAALRKAVKENDMEAQQDRRETA